MAVVLSVELCRLARVMHRVLMMAVRGVRVMAGGFVVARLMVPGRFVMMSRRVLVMLGCLAMMLCRLR